MGHIDDVMAATLREMRAARAGLLRPNRPLLIGQAAPKPQPNRRELPLHPNPLNSAGGRLWSMSGWTLDEWLQGTQRINTLSHFPGSSGKGDKFPRKAAQRSAERNITEHGMLDRMCLFVGKTNASCYVSDVGDPLRWVTWPDGQGAWAWVYHTSGIVQEWNDPDLRERYREFMRTIRPETQR